MLVLLYYIGKRHFCDNVHSTRAYLLNISYIRLVIPSSATEFSITWYWIPRCFAPFLLLFFAPGRSMCEEGSKGGGGSNAIPVYTASQIQGIREACRVRTTYIQHSKQQSSDVIFYLFIFTFGRAGVGRRDRPYFLVVRPSGVREHFRFMYPPCTSTRIYISHSKTTYCWG